MQNHGYLKPGIKSIFHFFCIAKFKSLVVSINLSPNNDRNHFQKMCYIFDRNEIDTQEPY
jgi:hypothetical protein